jgi:hypothetical protein
MAEVIKGDNTKGIKSVGELALRISKFDSYRLFTLYENVRERKLMDVSGNQKYYLVFKSPKKEIRIPEYDTKGFFEVDKVNGCVLFKITKKNAEDILSMKTGGEKIFHIIRVFEETDSFGRILNVTDEVEVYNGKWGDDSDFNTFTTENKVDLLTKALAAQVDKNAKLLNEYNDLLEKYNLEVKKTSDLEGEIEKLRAERDELQAMLNEYTGDTHDGIVLSTDTKYVALESSLENISFTEEQYKNAMDELLTKGSVELSDFADNKNEIEVSAKVVEHSKDLKDLNIYVKKNSLNMGNAIYGEPYNTSFGISDGDNIVFECIGVDVKTHFSFIFTPSENFKGSVTFTNQSPLIKEVSKDKNIIITTATVSFGDENNVPEDIGIISFSANKKVN